MRMCYKSNINFNSIKEYNKFFKKADFRCAVHAYHLGGTPACEVENYSPPPTSLASTPR